jgi:hypothetical protein
VQTATAQSKTGLFRDFGVAKAPPGFQAGWSNCMYFSLSLCLSCLLIWVFRVSFCTHDGTLPFRSCDQMSCREEVDVSFVVLGVLEPQIARNWFRSAAISRHLTNSVGRSLLRSAFFNDSHRSELRRDYPKGFKKVCLSVCKRPKRPLGAKSSSTDAQNKKPAFTCLSR